MQAVRSFIKVFFSLGIAVSTIQANGSQVDYQTLITFLENPTFNAPPSFNTLTGPLNVSQTNGSATPGTVRDIYGLIGTGVSLTSGNLVGARGEVNITDGNNIGGGAPVFLYGVQGKVVGTTGTIDVTTGFVTGVLGSLDLGTITMTSGKNSGVAATIQGVGSTGDHSDLYYGESVTGTLINSAFKVIANANFVFDITQYSTTSLVATTSSSVTNVGTKGWLRINVDGTARYIALGDGVT